MNVKTTLKLSEVGRHPLLQPDKIDGVLTYFPQRQNSYPLAQFMPLVEVNSDKVQMDIEKVSRGGMTPMVALGSESPVHGQYGTGSEEFEAAEFREKVILGEKDLYNLREIGSKDSMAQARNLLQRKFSQLEVRLLNRLEWMRRQVLFDGKVTATTAQGQPFELNYHHPSYLEYELTGTDMWTDLSNSDPVGDLQLWVEEFILHSGYMADRVIGPLGMFRLLQSNDKIQNIVTNNKGSFNGGRQAVTQHILDMTGIGVVEEWRDTISFATETTADVAAGGTSLTLANADELEAGDKIVIYDGTNKRRQELLTVQSVSGKTVTLSSAVQSTGGFAKGAPVRYAKHTIPLDKLIIVGTLDGPLSTENQGAQGPDVDKMNTWADVCTTLSRYADLDNPRPGVFTKMIDRTQNDPPHIEQVLGIRALPRLHYSEAWATVKFR